MFVLQRLCYNVITLQTLISFCCTFYERSPYLFIKMETSIHKTKYTIKKQQKKFNVITNVQLKI